MAATQPPLAELLKITEHWVEFDADNLVATSLFEDRNIPRYKVRNEELAQLHPDLPATIRALFSWLSKNKKQFHIEPRHVMDNARLLNGELLPFEDEDGQPRYFENVTLLKTFTYFKQDSLMVIRGNELTTECVDGVRFVVGFSNAQQSVSVSKTAMNKQYPGWETRWKIGTELEVDKEQLLAHVFSTPNPLQPGTTFGDVEFDQP